jgi:hypothetical protein
VFVPLDMGKTVVGMATKTAFAILLLCFVQVSRKFLFHKIKNGSHRTFHTTVCACPSTVSVVLFYTDIISAAFRNTTHVDLFTFVHGLFNDAVSSFDHADPNDAMISG